MEIKEFINKITNSPCGHMDKFVINDYAFVKVIVLSQIKFATKIYFWQGESDWENLTFDEVEFWIKQTTSDENDRILSLESDDE